MVRAVKTAKEEPKARVRVAVDQAAVVSQATAAGGPVPNPGAAPLSGEEVAVDVPHGYGLTDDCHHTHWYKAGAQKMPVEHAEHPYSKANGVTIV